MAVTVMTTAAMVMGPVPLAKNQVPPMPPAPTSACPVPGTPRRPASSVIAATPLEKLPRDCIAEAEWLLSASCEEQDRWLTGTEVRFALWHQGVEAGDLQKQIRNTGKGACTVECRYAQQLLAQIVWEAQLCRWSTLDQKENRGGTLPSTFEIDPAGGRDGCDSSQIVSQLSSQVTLALDNTATTEALTSQPPNEMPLNSTWPGRPDDQERQKKSRERAIKYEQETLQRKIDQWSEKEKICAEVQQSKLMMVENLRKQMRLRNRQKEIRRATHVEDRRQRDVALQVAWERTQQRNEEQVAKSMSTQRDIANLMSSAAAVRWEVLQTNRRKLMEEQEARQRAKSDRAAKAQVAANERRQRALSERRAGPPVLRAVRELTRKQKERVDRILEAELEARRLRLESKEGKPPTKTLPAVAPRPCSAIVSPCTIKGNVACRPITAGPSGRLTAIQGPAPPEVAPPIGFRRPPFRSGSRQSSKEHRPDDIQNDNEKIVHAQQTSSIERETMGCDATITADTTVECILNSHSLVNVMPPLPADVPEPHKIVLPLIDKSITNGCCGVELAEDIVDITVHLFMEDQLIEPPPHSPDFQDSSMRFDDTNKLHSLEETPLHPPVELYPPNEKKKDVIELKSSPGRADPTLENYTHTQVVHANPEEMAHSDELVMPHSHEIFPMSVDAQGTLANSREIQAHSQEGHAKPQEVHTDFLEAQSDSLEVVVEPDKLSLDIGKTILTSQGTLGNYDYQEAISYSTGALTSGESGALQVCFEDEHGHLEHIRDSTEALTSRESDALQVCVGNDDPEASPIAIAKEGIIRLGILMGDPRDGIVVDTMEGSWIDSPGVNAGDEMVIVDGWSVADMTKAELVNHLQTTIVCSETNRANKDAANGETEMSLLWATHGHARSAPAVMTIPAETGMQVLGTRQSDNEDASLNPVCLLERGDIPAEQEDLDWAMSPTTDAFNDLVAWSNSVGDEEEWQWLRPPAPYIQGSTHMPETLETDSVDSATPTSFHPRRRICYSRVPPGELCDFLGADEVDEALTFLQVYATHTANSA